MLFKVLVSTEDKSEIRGILEPDLKSLHPSDPAFKNNVITLHSFNRYFEKIGDHLWRCFVDPKSMLFQKKEEAFEELLDLVYEKTEQISNSLELFGFLDKSPLDINKGNIISSLMFYLLSERSKIVRGFIKDKFYLEFIRVYFVCRVIKTTKVGLKSIYSIVWPPHSQTENYPNDVEIVRIQAASKSTLLSFLRECPM